MQAGAVEEVDLVNVGNADQSERHGIGDHGAAFFPGFPDGGGNSGFAVFHESCRQCPETEAGFYGALAKQDASFPFGDAANNQVRVLVVNVAALWANRTWQIVSGRYFLPDGMSTTDAVVDWCFHRGMSPGEIEFGWESAVTVQ